MTIWNIRAHFSKTFVGFSTGFYADTLISAFARARETWPNAEVLECLGADRETGFTFPATMTLKKV